MPALNQLLLHECQQQFAVSHCTKKYFSDNWRVWDGKIQRLQSHLVSLYIFPDSPTLIGMPNLEGSKYLSS